MTLKERLIQELDGVSDPLIVEVLDFLRFLKTKQTTDSDDVQGARQALTTQPAAHAPAQNAPASLPTIQAIYTDGACSGNPGPGGWGTVLYLTDGSVHELGGAAPQTTNNRMEMQAAIAGLSLLLATGQSTPVELLTDSEYVKKGITEWISGWKRRNWTNSAKKPVLNKDLWQQLDDVNQAVARQTGSPVKWTYVRGHAGNAGNERCDEIARAYSLGQSIALHQHPVLNALPSGNLTG
jgi:ribonuclease HI